jgi:3-hydroxymyristoyl/3-hydroxydecanoyl-(acyl carrier protein) dehydratase
MKQVDLDQEGMLSFVREKQPFFLPESAMIVVGEKGGGSIQTITKVEEKHALGHFPGFPVVPLIRMCEIGAQSGLVLAAYIYHDGDPARRNKYVPLAVGCGQSKATYHDVVTAPCTLTVQGILTKEDGIKFEVDLTFLADMNDGQGQVKVGYLNSVEYIIMPAKKRFRAISE